MKPGAVENVVDQPPDKPITGKAKALDILQKMAEAWTRDVNDFNYGYDKGVEAQIAFTRFQFEKNVLMLRQAINALCEET